MTPMTLVSFLVGTLAPLMNIGSSVDNSLEKMVRRVADDLGADMCKFPDLNQAFSISR